MTPEREAEIEAAHAEVLPRLNSVPHLLSDALHRLRTASDFPDVGRSAWSVVLFDGPHRLKLTFEVDEVEG